MPHEGTRRLCLPGPPATSTRMLSGWPVIGSRMVVAHRLHPLRPGQLLEVAAEDVRRACGRGRRGTSETSSRCRPAAARLWACSGPRITKNSAWLIGALFMPSVVMLDADLAEDQLGVAVRLRVVHVVRAFAAVHGDGARRVDAAARRVPSHGLSARFSAAQNVYFARLPVRRRVAEARPGAGDVEQDQPHRPPNGGVGAGCRDRRRRRRR